MPVHMERDWIAVGGDRIMKRADTRQALLEKLPDDHGFEIVATPKNPVSGSFL